VAASQSVILDPAVVVAGLGSLIATGRDRPMFNPIVRMRCVVSPTGIFLTQAAADLTSRLPTWLCLGTRGAPAAVAFPAGQAPPMGQAPPRRPGPPPHDGSAEGW
jgi:hypothetical protein